MLVLARKAGETIIIEDQETKERIEVKVVRIGPNSVRLGTEASSRYRIWRDEVQAKVDAESAATES